MKGFALALASAALSILVHPDFGLVWLAPLCLAPILVAIAREPSPKRRALIGWAGGTLYWCGVCYWIWFVLQIYGGLSGPLVLLAFALFCVLRALPWALFAWLAGYALPSRWAVLFIAALWTGLERVYGPFSFAWLVLGNAGIDMSLPMRLAPITGVYGLSFVFAMMGTGVALLTLRRRRRDLLPLASLGLLYLLPALPALEQGTQTAVVVQPNIQERDDWTSQLTEETVRRMAFQALDVGYVRNQRPRLILWPEVPAPFYYETDSMLRDQASQLARTLQADFLFGAVAHTRQGAPLNSVFQVSPDGNYVARYDKMNLVPFGEYVPEAFSWITKISSEAGNFAPGSRQITFPTSGGAAGVFICYESVFPHFVRGFVREGAEVLVNLSNDGYFGRSAAREQHLLLVRMRAAENRRWVLRATNDGITATADPAGRVMHRLTPYAQSAARIRFSYVQEKTPYTRAGDWFVWGCLALGVASALPGLIRALSPRSATGNTPAAT